MADPSQKDFSAACQWFSASFDLSILPRVPWSPRLTKDTIHELENMITEPIIQIPEGRAKFPWLRFWDLDRGLVMNRQDGTATLAFEILRPPAPPDRRSGNRD